ncbi:MAG: hypothetical protein U0235_28605 [Polyangiaceae bacterium]
MSAVGLVGCGKIQSLIKGEPAADAAPPPPPPVAVDAAPPETSAAPSASAAPTAQRVVVRPKDAGAHDASADAAVDAGSDAGVVALRKPTKGAFSCDAAGCECETGAQCDITCPGVSSCRVTVRDLATATVHGAIGSVDLDCRARSTCKFKGAVGGSHLRCTGATCQVECGVGPCDIACAGGKCSFTKKGPGATKCSGPGCS